MLSHLRFHRRGTSNPSSPVPEHQQSFSPPSGNESPQTLDPVSPHDGISNIASSSHAPLLPPIARVTSSESDFRNDKRDTPGLTPETRPQQAQLLSYTGDSGFIGGVALQHYRRDFEAQQMTTRIDVVDGATHGHAEDIPRHYSHNDLELPADASGKGQIRKVSSFSTPTDLQRSNSSNLGRRPAGARLPQQSAMMLSGSSLAASAEAPKSKKGLPFLKNPMSTLLMRRRNNQNAPDLRPLPLNKKDEEPVYDPRIRGTRVHDFSAPRKSREAHIANSSIPHPSTDASCTATKQNLPTVSDGVEETAPGATENITQSSHTSMRSQSYRTVQTASRNASSGSVYSTDDQNYHPDSKTGAIQSPKRHEKRAASPRPDASQTSPSEQLEKIPAMSSSTRTSRSRNVSLSEVSISAIPKHMKSTSSRFSFDMVGAAKQERLLEERHRQRELGRQAAGDDGHRDSRFDEFDEDAFDYDAMMDDDGLEEKIPGVNADFEDEDFPGSEGVELDPDNDQENFAGFVFQRSNLASAMASPYSARLMTTPRDADGNVIGFAMSKDTPKSSTFPTQSQLHHQTQSNAHEENPAGLGIQHLARLTTETLQGGDDLYYDDGMIGFEEDIAEHPKISPDMAQQPFDESIFDENDTDQFGRPVPGAFQQAQSLRQAAQHPSRKRESGLTSRLSAPSALSHSTTHTSLSPDDMMDEMRQEPLKESPPESQPQDTQTIEKGVKSIAAYQAALAAAAHRAAATGKFQRSSSPSSSSYYMEDDNGPSLDEDDELRCYDDIDDGFDFGDDAIIAEANASALANDLDGWYGQEFGFYSAPPNSHMNSHGAISTNPKGYEYANGGFFGPGGMDGLNRSISGRLISREPNLTPITERSEYSNRNSLMSLGYPPLSTSTPIVQSPGLAQLAMMADSRDDQMTLSALLRLRSKAWGGSQASLASSREGSPRSERGDTASSSWPSNSLGVVGQANHGHGRKPSTGLAISYDDESDELSASSSPTMTMPQSGFDYWQNVSIPEEETTQAAPEIDGSGLSVPKHGTRPRADDGSACPVSETLDVYSSRGLSDAARSTDEEMLSSVKRSSTRTHRHKSSADSVSYIKKEDSGETHWVLERRRTADSGEVEVLDREVIEGRRI